MQGSMPLPVARPDFHRLVDTDFKTHHSRYGLHAHRVAYATFYTEGFSSFVASAAASIATGWNELVPGRDFPPAEDHHLFTAHSD
jgi:hypothetical protein